MVRIRRSNREIAVIEDEEKEKQFSLTSFQTIICVIKY